MGRIKTNDQDYMEMEDAEGAEVDPQGDDDSPEDEAAFLAGYGSADEVASTDKAPVVDAPAADEPDKVEADASRSDAAAKPVAEPAPDSGTTPDPAESDGKIASRLRKVEGTVGTLSDQLSRALEANAKLVEPKKGPTPEQIADAATSSEKLKEFGKEWPEAADAVNEGLDLLEKRLLDKIPTAEAIDSAITESFEAGRAVAKLDRKHENWEETVNSGQFEDWQKAQPAEVRALAGSKDAADASKMLDLYKKSLQDAKPEPDEPNPKEVAREAQRRRLQDAVAPTIPGSSNRRDETPDVDEAFEEGFYGNRNRIR